MKPYTCPECGKRGVTERKGRHEGRFRCRYCAHYPGWLSPPSPKVAPINNPPFFLYYTKTISYMQQFL